MLKGLWNITKSDRVIRINDSARGSIIYSNNSAGGSIVLPNSGVDPEGRNKGVLIDMIIIFFI